MPARPLITFVAATYNRGPTVVDCLRKTLREGIAPLSRELVRFIVIDNASTDSTREWVHQANEGVELIALPKNCGPVAKNIGMRQALRAGSEYVVILDDDAYPQPGAVERMMRHFQEDPRLGAAVFDVQLLNGVREASAFPDVFIGAGTGFRANALLESGLLPSDYFMQAEEYDLSFRLWDAGWKVKRFLDMPLTHLKSPGARIGQRTTGLDVRNNLYLLAKYVPDPLATAFAADWLARYWMMAESRDARDAAHPTFGTHRHAFVRGAAQGLKRWSGKRAEGQHLLRAETVEKLFKFEAIRKSLAAALERHQAKRILFADLGKNMLPFWKASQGQSVGVEAIVDENLGKAGREYRGVPLIPWTSLGVEQLSRIDLIVVSNMAPIQGPARAAALKKMTSIPVEILVDSPFA